MINIATARSKIYDYFQGSETCWAYFGDQANDEQYAAYYNSMFLLQDSTDALGQHRARGFSPDPLQAYLEFWGVMQAIIIQQDAINEIHCVMLGARINAGASGMTAWQELRRLRNICAGHPAKRDLPRGTPPSRAFMARGFGNYDQFRFELWEQGAGVTHPRVPFGALLNAYAIEAEALLQDVLAAMKRRWP